MVALSQQILKMVEALPEEEQRQLLDYAEFLQFKQRRQANGDNTAKPTSFLEGAKDVIGIAEGPGDLLSNSEYMDGYGQS